MSYLFLERLTTRTHWQLRPNIIRICADCSWQRLLLNLRAQCIDYGSSHSVLQGSTWDNFVSKTIAGLNQRKVQCHNGILGDPTWSSLMHVSNVGWKPESGMVEIPALQPFDALAVPNPAASKLKGASA